MEQHTKQQKGKQLRIGKTQKKILLLLLGGLALGLSRSPKRYFKILRSLKKAWKEIDNQYGRQSIQRLYKSQLIEEKYNKDGTVNILLSNEGERRALQYKIDNMEIKTPKRWDNTWWIITFDIPEELRKIRNSLRFHLKKLGFHELQKSVFIHPFNCIDEIEFIIDFYKIPKFVRIIHGQSIDNEIDLKNTNFLG